MTGFIINTTFSVAKNVNDSWLKWVKEEFIPFVESSGIGKSYLLSRVLLQGGEDDFTYSLQINIQDPQQSVLYDSLCQFTLERQLAERFPNSVYFFKTVLKIID